MVLISEEVRTQMIAQDRMIGLHDIRLAELDLRVQCAETTNYDGILIWKIIEYPRRKHEAVAGTPSRVLAKFGQTVATDKIVKQTNFSPKLRVWMLFPLKPMKQTFSPKLGVWCFIPLKPMKQTFSPKLGVWGFIPKISDADFLPKVRDLVLYPPKAN